MEKMEVKVVQKGKRTKTIKERKNEWGVVNGEGKEARRMAILGGLKDGEEEDGDQAAEMEEVVEDGSMTVPTAPAVQETTEVNGMVEREDIAEEDKIT